MPVKPVASKSSPSAPQAPKAVSASAQCNDPSQKVTVENGGQIRISGPASNRGVVQSRVALQFDGKKVDVPLAAGSAYDTYRAIEKALPKGYRANVLLNPNSNMVVFEIQKAAGRASPTARPAKPVEPAKPAEPSAPKPADVFEPQAPAPEKAPAGPTATVQFQPGFTQALEGKLAPGGKLTIEYDPRRAQITHSHNGHPAWGVQAFVKMMPSGKVTELPAVEFLSRAGTPTNTPVARAVTVEIPKDATEVQVWFKNWTGADRPGEAWDSNLGRNYTFAVAG